MTALALLETLVGIPSVNPFRYFARPSGAGFVGLGAETEMNLFVERQLRDVDFQVHRQELHGEETLEIEGRSITVPARWNVLGVKYPAGEWNGKSILFFGHTDTVDVKQGWKTNPFSIARQRHGDREVWVGLGANDMKGGLAAILDAVTRSAPSQYAIKVAFLADEEFYSFGADFLCRSEFLSDVVLAIAPEIGDSLVASKNDSLNDQQIGIGRLGRIEYDVEIAGRACHGADAFLHAEAVNAVHESAKLQAAIAEDCAKQKRGFSSHGAEAINSAYISCHRGGEAMLSVPDRASFVLDRTFLPDESPDAELARLRSIVSSLQASGGISPSARISVAPRPRPTPPCLPYVFSPDLPEVRRAVAAVKLHSERPRFSIGRSVADENRIAVLGIPTLTIGPTGAGSHTPEEWVDPQSVERTAAIFSSLIAAS